MEDVVEHRPGAVDLAVLALEQRDLLAVFADAREIEAEVRLDRLLAEIEARQAAADEMRDAGREPRRRAPRPRTGSRESRTPKIGAFSAFEIPHRMIENDTRLVAEEISWIV